MGCINPDNSLTATAKRMLQIVSVPVPAERIAKELSIPMFKTRSSLREMTGAGLIEERDGLYIISGKGKELLNK